MPSMSQTLNRFSDKIALMWFLVLTYASLSPLEQIPAAGDMNDKVLHIAAYSILSFFSIIRRKSVSDASKLVVAIILYSGFIELVQPYVNRQGDIADLIANSVGAIMGGLVIAGLYKIKVLRID